jgi:hypothetical protein
MKIARILALCAIGVVIMLAQGPTGSNAKGKGKAYVPAKTSWGEPDLQGIWPLNHLISVPLQRPVQYGDRLFLNDDEFAKVTAKMANKGKSAAPIPVADSGNRPMRQTSLIIDPKNGRFPELTEYGKKLQAEMKSTYHPTQTVFDTIEDFAAWDRCITRGMPVSMLPRNYNNGVRIVQSPGYVVIMVEMAHEARIIPTNGAPPLPSQVKQWLGESRGHWEGNTLVVETTNYNGKVGLTSAGVPGSPAPLQPETPDMKTIERFTRVAPDQIDFEMRIEDKATLAQGYYTVAYPMYLDNKYEMYEYACHEGNSAVRNYIEASRFERANPQPVNNTKGAAKGKAK